jgi:hypothetical protein
MDSGLPASGWKPEHASEGRISLIDPAEIALTGLNCYSVRYLSLDANSGLKQHKE